LPARISLSIQENMRETCDVAVIGGAFSGAATSLLLRREAPGLRVVVIERSKQFDRKVGEATTEVSGCFLTKRLALTHHLCHHHVVKNGLRFWFSQGPEDDLIAAASWEPLIRCVCRLIKWTARSSMSTCFPSRKKPARMFGVLRRWSLSRSPKPAPPRIMIRDAGGERELVTRWINDASGRASVLDRIVRETRGECCDLEDLNRRFSRSFRSWFEALYRDKYHYLGDKELMTAAFLMDLGLFFVGPVRSVIRFVEFPFEGSLDGAIVSGLMAFYNKRLARIARKRLVAGAYGLKNLDFRTLLRGFEPNRQVWKPIFRGLRIWLGAELRSFFLPAAASAPVGCPASAI
jgi:hypothetical protein